MEDDKSIKKIREDTSNKLCKAFEELAKSIDESSNAFNSLMDSYMKKTIQEAYIDEMKWMEKLVCSCWFTRWYYRMKYRKAKYCRIQIERIYNQNIK